MLHSELESKKTMAYGKNMFRITAFALIMVSMVLSMDARPRSVDFKKRSDFSKKVFEKERANAFEAQSGFQGQRFSIKEWHKRYSPLGRKKAPLDTNNTILTENTIEKKELELDEAPLSTQPKERKMARVHNWNRMREAIVHSKYDKLNITSPVAQHLQDLVDEVSLADINRFQTVRNEPEDSEGIPVESVGEETVVE